MSAFAVDFDLDEVLGDGPRKTQNARGGFVDLAQRSLTAAIDAGSGPVAGARAKVPGDQASTGVVPGPARAAMRAPISPKRRNWLDPSRSRSVSKTSRLSRPGVPSWDSAKRRALRKPAAETSVSEERLPVRVAVNSASMGRSGSGAARATGS
jgi:hypothetical protein